MLDAATNSRQPVANIKTPAECSPGELATFEKLVRMGGEVNNDGLSERIRAADALLFLTVGGELIGVGALKKPDAGHRDQVFRLAHSSLRPEDFPLEKGWTYIIEPYRGKGLSKEIALPLLAYAGTRRVYATCRAENKRIRRSNENHGLTLEGQEFPGRGDYKLVLYIR